LCNTNESGASSGSFRLITFVVGCTGGIVPNRASNPVQKVQKRKYAMPASVKTMLKKYFDPKKDKNCQKSAKIF
jgi:hypothetical protein